MGRLNACPSSEGWPYGNVPGQLWDSCFILDEVVIIEILPSTNVH